MTDNEVVLNTARSIVAAHIRGDSNVWSTLRADEAERIAYRIVARLDANNLFDA